MLSNNKLKYLRSLHQRKFRQKYHNFIAEGEKIVGEVLATNPTLVETVCALPEWLEKNVQILNNLEAEVLEVNDLELKKISLLNAPNKVLIVIRQPDFDFEGKEVQSDFSLYLEDIRDPGNLGTILRIADWFGIKHVFCSGNCVEVFNPKVVQASMGAFLRVKAPTVDFFDLKEELGEFPIYGAALGGDSVFKTKIPASSMLVIGNESKGISAETMKGLTKKVAIPKHEQGGAESLNAAIATGILCSVFRNQ